MRTDQFLPLTDRKADIATKRSLCAADVGSNDRFLIHKRTFGEAAANDRFWPKVALRRHRKNVRLYDSHEGLESTQIGHSRWLTRTSAMG